MPLHTRPIELPPAFSAIDGLGAPVAYFSSKRAGRRIGFLSALVLFILALLAFLSGWITDVQWAMTMGLILFFAALAALLYAIARGHFSVVAFEDGLACQTGKKVSTWHWDEVSRFYLSISRLAFLDHPSARVHYLKLEFSGNERRSFDDHLPNAGKLAEIIEQHTAPVIYRKAASTFNTTGEVEFGPIRLNLAGIMLKSTSFHWEEIEHLVISNGILKVSATGKRRASLRVDAIPNLRALLDLLQQFCQVSLSEE